jgi:hypothetical protein
MKSMGSLWYGGEEIAGMNATEQTYGVVSPASLSGIRMILGYMRILESQAKSS